MEKEDKEIIKRYHQYVMELLETQNPNVDLFKHVNFKPHDEMSCQWLVLAVLSIQDEVRKEK
jgi:hypothetical protein